MARGWGRPSTISCCAATGAGLPGYWGARRGAAQRKEGEAREPSVETCLTTKDEKDFPGP